MATIASLVIRALFWATKALWKATRRWPAAAIVVAATLIILWPLGVDCYRALPSLVRDAGAWCIFAVFIAVGLHRIWRIEPQDDAPPADPPTAYHWTSLVPALVCVAMAIPYLRDPGNLGYGDWDLNLAKYEAVRRTVLEWGEFPWWDPWCRGGFPLAANPQCGVFGIATPLVLALGTSVGMRIAQLGCLLIAIEGARRLALLWFGEPLAAAAAGLIYGINGAVLSQAVCGYHLTMSYCSFPWILYYAFRLDRRRSDGAWLGFWLAFNVLNGINYYNVYAILIAAIVWLRAIRVRVGRARSRYLIHTLLAVSVLLTLAGWRLATTGLVYRDFPRPYHTRFDLSPWSILMCLITRPRGEDMLRIRFTEYWELLWYIGPVALCAGGSEPGARLAMVAHAYRRVHLARGRLIRVVPPELLAFLLASFFFNACREPLANHGDDGLCTRRGRRIGPVETQRVCPTAAIGRACASCHRGRLRTTRLPDAASRIQHRAERFDVSRCADPIVGAGARGSGICRHSERLRRDPDSRATSRLRYCRRHRTALSRASRIHR